MSKHTPGPWSVQDETSPPRRAFGIVSHNGREVAHYLAFDDHRRFAHTTALPEEAEANARLIAAAPDLLAALRCFLDDPRFQVGVGGNPIVVERMIDQARAAYGKATGE